MLDKMIQMIKLTKKVQILVKFKNKKVFYNHKIYKKVKKIWIYFKYLKKILKKTHL